MAAGIITSGSFPKSLELGVKKWFGANYNDYPTEWSDIFSDESSQKQFEDEVGISGLGLHTVKPEGQSVEYDDMEQGFTARYIHKVYANGFIVTREAIDDNRYTEVGLRNARALARGGRQTEEIVGANVLNRAFNSSYTMGSNHDGKELCATDHPHAGGYGGTYQNELTTGTDLSEAALEDMDILIAQAKDSRGQRIRLMARKLVIPVQLKFVADRILNSDRQSGTANNDLNSLRNQSILPGGFCVNHYLTDANNWFVLTDCPDGMKHMSRHGMEFGKDGDFDSGNQKFKAMKRYSFGWTDPYGIFGSEVA